VVPHRHRPELRAALGVAALAGAVRVVWVLAASRTPRGLSDPGIYLAAARSIADGDGYTSLLGQPTAYYPPGYPFFLGAVQWAADLVGLEEHSVLLTGLVQALLGGLAAGAVVLAGARLTGRAPDGRVPRAGVAAGVLVALWPNLVLHSALVLSETVFLAGFCLLLAALCHWTGGDGSIGGRRWPLPAAIVVTTAWCTLVRPQSAVLVVPAALLAWWVAGVPWRHALRGVGLVVAGVALAVVPWAARNAVVMDAAVPMSTNTGDNLCIGFNDDADGTFQLTEECATEGRYVDGPEVEVARDGELRGRALRWIRDHPGELPRLSAAKLAVTFAHDDDAVSAWESYGADRHLSDGVRSALRWLSDLYYWPVGLAALAGAALAALDARRARRERVAGPAGALLAAAVTLGGALVVVAFFGDERFKVPIVPCLAMLAAYPLARRARDRQGDVGDPTAGDREDAARAGDAGGTVAPEPVERVEPAR